MTLKSTTFVIIVKPTLAKAPETVTFVVVAFLKLVDSSSKYLWKSSYKNFSLVSISYFVNNTKLTSYSLCFGKFHP